MRRVGRQKVKTPAGLCPCGCGQLASRMLHGQGELCACGCGERTNVRSGYPQVYLPGHFTRVARQMQDKDDHNLRWRSELTKFCAGGCGTVFHGRTKYAPGHWGTYKKTGRCPVEEVAGDSNES